MCALLPQLPGLPFLTSAQCCPALLPCREGRDTSPISNEPLHHKMLMPCPLIKRCVHEAVAVLRDVRQQGR